MGLLGVKIQDEGRGKTYQMLTFLPRSKLSKFFGLFSFLRKYLLARHHWLTIFTFLLIMTRDERKQAPLAQCSTLRVLKFSAFSTFVGIFVILTLFFGYDL